MFGEPGDGFFAGALASRTDGHRPRPGLGDAFVVVVAAQEEEEDGPKREGDVGFDF